MKIGLISDTHGYLDPRVNELLAGVDHILHAGDIGPERLILELERVAPVTAVLGNTDVDLTYKETEAVELGGLRILLHHIVSPTHPSTTVSRWLEQFQPHVVVYGHTHQQDLELRDSVLYVNPGYTGKPRFGQPRGLAILEPGEGLPRVTFLPL